MEDIIDSQIATIAAQAKRLIGEIQQMQQVLGEKQATLQRCHGAHEALQKLKKAVTEKKDDDGTEAGPT